MTRTSRLAVVASLMLILAAIPGVAMAASYGDDRLDVVRYGGDQYPSAIVTYENGSLADIQDWANASSARSLIATDDTLNQAVVAAPIYHLQTDRLAKYLALDFGVDPLTDRTYVTDVSLNYRMANAEPVTLSNASGVDVLELPWRMRVSRFGEDLPTSGLAFKSDANTTTPAEVRSVVHSSSYTGSGELVAVIDTGANTADGEVFGNGTIGSPVRIHNDSKSFITGESVNASAGDWAAIRDGNGHGTWVASMLAANTTDATFDGMVPEADLLVLKALDDEGSGETADIAAAIRYAADHNADVISMSLGSPVYSDALATAIEYAQDEGSVVVVAVGNSRQTTRWIATPADVDGVIGVGATNGSANDTAGSAYFSQLGPDPGTVDLSETASQGATVDVAAPGMAIVTKTPSTDGYVTNTTLSGTSMATPIVAGGAVQIVDAHPSWERSEVAQWIRDGAVPVPNAAESEVGNGYVHVVNAIDETDGGDQSNSMDPAAEERDTIYQGMSDAEGGVLARLRGSVGV